MHKSDMDGELIQCDKCPAMLKGRNKLYNHIQAKHNFVTCDICNKSFQKQCIGPHMRTHTKPFQCSVCHAQFAEKKVCENHELGHFGRNPNKCEICGKCFGEKSKLNAHMMTHSDTRDFLCKFCFKAFRTKVVRRNHERQVHATENNYHCTEADCGRSFKSNASLYQHIKVTHKKGMTLSCNFCGSLFPTGSLLRAHMARCGWRTTP